MFIDNYSATSSTLHKDNTVIFINQYNIDPHQYETYVSNIYVQQCTGPINRITSLKIT